MSALYHSAEKQRKSASVKLDSAIARLLVSTCGVSDLEWCTKANIEIEVLILTIAYCKNYWLLRFLCPCLS